MNGYQKKRIKEALDYLQHLSEWENQFIKDLADKDDSYQLSKKQNHYLNKISEKVGKI